MSILNTSNYKLGGTLPAEAVGIALYPEIKQASGRVVANTSAGNLLEGLAGQQVQAQVQKGVRPVYEIGSTYYYLIDGRPQGQGQIAYLFGPSGVVVAGIKKFANLCHTCALKVWHSGASHCGPDSPAGGTKPSKKAEGEAMIFSGGTLTSFSITATAENFMVTGDIGFIFMDVREPGT